MYIQITTRCNMSCEHCAFSCGKSGEDMTLDTFREALEFAEYYGTESITIGGGEPTLHPKFAQMLLEAMGVADVWLATNGSNTRMSLTLARMAKQGVIGCALSQDPWHDEIDYDVIEAFTVESRNWHDEGKDRREIRNVESSVMAVGRAVENEVYVQKGCACETTCIDPNGDIFTCGCKTHKVGNVNDSFDDLPDTVCVECLNFSAEYVEDEDREILEAYRVKTLPVLPEDE